MVDNRVSRVYLVSYYEVNYFNKLIIHLSTSMVKKIRILVVGAGPGGTSAAYFLKKYDEEEKFSVDLIDRLSSDKYHRYHDMCGEGISKDLLKEISPLQPDGIAEEIHSFQEYWPDDIFIETKMDGFILDRGVFLESIINQFQQEGGTYQTATVTSVEQKKDYVKVKINEEYKKYDYVIGADGPHSLLRKYLGLNAKTKLFLQYIVEKEPEHGTLKLYYDEKYHGDYLWEFPHENHVKIGFPANASVKPMTKENIVLKQSKYICYGGLKHYVRGNILLVGDAAAQTNAITKGGIRSAMTAGKYAAQALFEGNPLLYENKWKNSDYSSPLFTEAMTQLEEMSNIELAQHMEPFRRGYSVASYLKSIVFYRKYSVLYKAYALSNKVGW